MVPTDLSFALQPGAESRATLQLQNTGENHAVAFRVKVTTPERYSVSPNEGIVPVGGHVRLTAAVAPAVVAQLLQATSASAVATDTFLIQLVELKDGERLDEEEVRRRWSTVRWRRSAQEKRVPATLFRHAVISSDSSDHEPRTPVLSYRRPTTAEEDETPPMTSRPTTGEEPPPAKRSPPKLRVKAKAKAKTRAKIHATPLLSPRLLKKGGKAFSFDDAPAGAGGGGGGGGDDDFPRVVTSFCTQGELGPAYDGLDNRTGKVVSMKVLALRDPRIKPEVLRALRSRVLVSERVVPIVEVVSDGRYVRVLSEFVPLGASVASLFDRRDPMRNPGHFARLVRDVVLALVDIHSTGLAHADLDEKACLVGDDGRVVLTQPVWRWLPRGSPWAATAANGVIGAPPHEQRSKDLRDLGRLVVHLVTGRADVVPDLLPHQVAEFVSCCMSPDAIVADLLHSQLLRLATATDASPLPQPAVAVSEETLNAWQAAWRFPLHYPRLPLLTAQFIDLQQRIEGSLPAAASSASSSGSSSSSESSVSRETRRRRKQRAARRRHGGAERQVQRLLATFPGLACNLLQVVDDDDDDDDDVSVSPVVQRHRASPFRLREPSPLRSPRVRKAVRFFSSSSSSSSEDEEDEEDEADDEREVGEGMRRVGNVDVHLNGASRVLLRMWVRLARQSLEARRRAEDTPAPTGSWFGSLQPPVEATADTGAEDDGILDALRALRVNEAAPTEDELRATVRRAVLLCRSLERLRRLHPPTDEDAELLLRSRLVSLQTLYMRLVGQTVDLEWQRYNGAVSEEDFAGGYTIAADDYSQEYLSASFVYDPFDPAPEAPLELLEPEAEAQWECEWEPEPESKVDDSWCEDGPPEPESFVAIGDYDALDDRQLPVLAGDEVLVTAKDASGWWFGELTDGRAGWVPSNYLHPIHGDLFPINESPLRESMSSMGTPSPSPSRPSSAGTVVESLSASQDRARSRERLDSDLTLDGVLDESPR